ncbi:MAG: hypothetical protein AAGH87_03000 [Pseudomonadota bacterium]
MSLPAPIRRNRARALSIVLAAIAALLAFVAVDAAIGAGGVERSARFGAPVLPGVDLVADVAAIEVRLADETYRLVRNGEVWRQGGAAGYPVRPDRIGALLTGLAGLTWAEEKTRDPRKFSQLGLADPDDGGNGAELILRGDDGEILAGLIAGRRGETLYLRRRGEAVSFAVDGALPPLNSARSWLDFQVIAMVPGAIEGVVLEAGNGERLHLVRQAGGGPRDFVPGPAHSGERLVSRLAAATPALALSRFSPLGVIPETELQSAPVARHTTLTQDGLEVIAQAYEEPGGVYLTLRAVEAAEGARRAEAINARAAGWAFRLSRYDWGDFTPEISDIVERAIVDAP